MEGRVAVIRVKKTLIGPGGPKLEKELANLLAKHFIARPDVKAIQYADGSWSPHTDTGKRDGARIPWKRDHIVAHLKGEATFGHYLLNTNDQCKLFCFDIDLKTSGFYPEGWNEGEISGITHSFNPREAWRDRRHPARAFMKWQFRIVAHRLMSAIEDLGVKTVAAYSGNKGIHVYGLTGPIAAYDAREAAHIVLENLDMFELERGEHIYRFKNSDPLEGFPNLSLEVYPKQDSLEGKDLGNLLRLPLGKNLKAKDPTFFIDMTAPMGVLEPMDPIFALTATSPWQHPDD